MILNLSRAFKKSPNFRDRLQGYVLRLSGCVGSVAIQAALLLSLSSVALAEEQLVQLVEISARLIPAEGAVPGQRIKLEVTVATPRWFTAGTRIKLPEVPGLLLLQNQDFAANATERRDGESWTVQRWFIDVFATRPGT